MGDPREGGGTNGPGVPRGGRPNFGRNLISQRPNVDKHRYRQFHVTWRSRLLRSRSVRSRAGRSRRCHWAPPRQVSVATMFVRIRASQGRLLPIFGRPPFGCRATCVRPAIDPDTHERCPPQSSRPPNAEQLGRKSARNRGANQPVYLSYPSSAPLGPARHTHTHWKLLLGFDKCRASGVFPYRERGVDDGSRGPLLHPCGRGQQLPSELPILCW